MGMEVVPTLENDFFTGRRRGLDEAFIQNEASGSQVKKEEYSLKKKTVCILVTPIDHVTQQ